MTKLLWSRTGERSYEAGIDHGVLYLADGTAVPWNGLTSIDEDFGNDSSAPYFLDGVKYLDIPTTDDFNATLKALTYPDEFLAYDGVTSLGNGLYVDGQQHDTFGLSYRTLIGSDNGDLGYKLHLCYNLTAASDDLSYETLGDSPSAMEFSWKIRGVPEDAPGYRPTAHVIIDSRYVYSAFLPQLEAILYGTDTTDPRLPPLAELIPMVTGWRLIYIYDNGDGTWTATGPPDLVKMLDATKFQISGANVVYLDTNTYQISETFELQGG